MVHPLRITLLLSTVFTAGLVAQTPPPLAAPSAVTPGSGVIVSGTDAPVVAGKPVVPRTISSDVAAQLAASRPKFSPVAPPPPPKPEEELADLRETDKPKNTIIRLPKMVVQEPRPPVFTERDLNTKKGLAAMAMRRYMTEADRAMNRFSLPLFAPISTKGTSNEVRAMQMYEDDERLKNMADAADHTNMVMKSDPAAGTKMKNETRDMFLRWQDFGWNGGSPK